MSIIAYCRKQFDTQWCETRTVVSKAVYEFRIIFVVHTVKFFISIDSGVLEWLKRGTGLVTNGIWQLFSLLTWTNLASTYSAIRGMSIKQIITTLIQMIVFAFSFIFNATTVVFR